MGGTLYPKSGGGGIARETGDVLHDKHSVFQLHAVNMGFTTIPPGFNFDLPGLAMAKPGKFVRISPRVCTEILVVSPETLAVTQTGWDFDSWMQEDETLAEGPDEEAGVQRVVVLSESELSEGEAPARRTLSSQKLPLIGHWKAEEIRRYEVVSAAAPRASHPPPPYRST